jgi:hypothetical protein
MLYSLTSSDIDCGIYISPNKLAEAVALPSYIQEGHSENLGSFVIVVSPSRQILGQSVELGRDRPFST